MPGPSLDLMASDGFAVISRPDELASSSSTNVQIRTLRTESRWRWKNLSRDRIPI